MIVTVMVVIGDLTWDWLGKLGKLMLVLEGRWVGVRFGDWVYMYMYMYMRARACVCVRVY